MMKLLSTNYSASSFNIALLILRVCAGALLMSHGYDKLVHFAEYQKSFMNFLGIGSSLSLALVIFSEFFCSIFLIIGLFSRLVTIPIIIGLCVAVFKAHNGEVFGKGELGSIYLASFITILLVGPGRISIDGMIKK